MTYGTSRNGSRPSVPTAARTISNRRWHRARFCRQRSIGGPSSIPSTTSDVRRVEWFVDAIGARPGSGVRDCRYRG
jgi:hypothetical protein